MTPELSCEQYFKILDALPDHVFIFSEQGVYLNVFGGSENKIGSDCKDYIGHSLYEVMPGDMATMFHNGIRKTLVTNQVQYMKYNFSNEHIQALPYDLEAHDELWIEGVLQPFTLECGTKVVIWTARNVTDKHYMEVRLRQLSEIDVLTGIFNRRAFMSALAIALKSYHRYKSATAFLMLDIDNFKKINDRLGHLVGDEVIQHVTSLSQLELRESDIIGRLGGEEFAIILSHTNLQQAWNIADRLRQRIESSFYDVNGQKITVTVSIGVSQFEPDDDACKYVLTRSDRAMYQSKREGRNRVTIYHEELVSNKV